MWAVGQQEGFYQAGLLNELIRVLAEILHDSLGGRAPV